MPRKSSGAIKVGKRYGQTGGTIYSKTSGRDGTTLRKTKTPSESTQPCTRVQAVVGESVKCGSGTSGQC
ncbi:unnamed protein product [Toxocara canis]|uniref:DUF4236 domain-containing protein n=1 Tax=Toxocara canis TaxID=6265 RepID=A0A183U959_TOXCA|nr:unnamed protein product [Toxocara canis]